MCWKHEIGQNSATKMKISQRKYGFNFYSRRFHMSHRHRWPFFVIFLFIQYFFVKVIHSIIMKFHSFLGNCYITIFGFHSIQKNIHVLTRALIQFKISFNSKKILVIHSRKLFIFLKNQLSDTPISTWWCAIVSNS